MPINEVVISVNIVKINIFVTVAVKFLWPFKTLINRWFVKVFLLLRAVYRDLESIEIFISEKKKKDPFLIIA